VDEGLAVLECAGYARLVQEIELAQLEIHAVQVVDVEIRPDQGRDLVTPLQQAADHVGSDEAVGAGDEDLHARIALRERRDWSA
jgi:hypothetical protein